uniref:LYR motif-containing protein 2 n=1 Tax=Tetraodon nigroviridis TaxID=99883 RepID=H3C6R5_TETNG
MVAPRLPPATLSLKQFLQRQKILGLYREILRTIRQVPEEEDRKYLRGWAREEFQRNKSAGRPGCCPHDDHAGQQPPAAAEEVSGLGPELSAGSCCPGLENRLLLRDWLRAHTHTRTRTHAHTRTHSTKVGSGFPHQLFNWDKLPSNKPQNL